MPAYFISVRDSMKDAAAYAAYAQKAGPSLAGRDMRLVVANGGLTPLEGGHTDGVVIIEFPTVQAAKDWYESPAYQAVVGERLAATEGRAFIVEGIPAG